MCLEPNSHKHIIQSNYGPRKTPGLSQHRVTPGSRQQIPADLGAILTVGNLEDMVVNPVS